MIRLFEPVYFIRIRLIVIIAVVQHAHHSRAMRLLTRPISRFLTHLRLLLLAEGFLEGIQFRHGFDFTCAEVQQIRHILTVAAIAIQFRSLGFIRFRVHLHSLIQLVQDFFFVVDFVIRMQLLLLSRP